MVKKSLLWLVVLASLWFLGPLLPAATYTVDDDGPADFTSIQDAINFASPNDTVYVFPGTYNEQVTMKDRVNLFGSGPHATTIDGQGLYDQVVTFNGLDGAIISGFRITGSSNTQSWTTSGLYCMSGPLVIKNNIIENNLGGICVKNRSARPTIVNNTIVDNLNGIILGPATGRSGVYLAYIYDADKDGANSYASVLRENGFWVDLIPLAAVEHTSFAKYGLIIVGSDTSFGYDWGSPQAVAAIQKSGKPVLGLGYGGAGLFQQMQLSICWGNGWIGTKNSIYVVNPEHPVFNRPNAIVVPPSGIINLYKSTGHIGLYAPSLSPDAVLLGREADNKDHYPLVQEGRHVLWGFSASPANMSQAGKALFINTVHYFACYTGLPRPDLIATGSEAASSPGQLRYRLSIANWRAFPDALFAPAPDLPPCGANSNASRTWIDIFAEGGTKLYGFCAKYSAESLLTLWFSWPEDSPPPNVYVVLNDRRCNIKYTSNLVIPQRERPVSHTIMNNIIASNRQTGIFYYTYLADGDILYNDVWGNSFRNYHDNSTGTTFVPYPGTGEISADPCFAGADYRLAEGSPCIDAGHPGAQYNDPDGTRNDMGAYGGPEAAARGGFHGSGFIITDIGDIPAVEVIQDSGQPCQGLVDVNSDESDKLGIPEYNDCPLGGNLWVHGLFGNADPVTHYQILVGKWQDANEPALEDCVPLNDPLTKVKYFIDDANGTVTHKYISLGPKSIAGVDNLYELTRGDLKKEIVNSKVFWTCWSQADLRMRWNSRSWENGKYVIRYRAYRYIPPLGISLLSLGSNDLDHITLVVDNTPVDANIHSVKYDTGEVIPECGIIGLASDTENVKFNITASHPNGYLKDYWLAALYGKNKNLGYVVMDHYTGFNEGGPPFWHGVTETTFDSNDAQPVQLLPWKTCAYQFRLHVRARTTDGRTGFIYQKEFNDHYYLDVGGCAWCGGADINHTGRVDWADFAIMAENWLESCGPTCD